MEGTKYNRGVTSLNNIGCVLLEQGAFHQAVETFQNAVCLSRAINGLQSSQESYLAMKAMLQEASFHMAFPRPTQSQSLITPTISVGFVTLQDYSQLMVDDLLLFDPIEDKQFLICPCRIDDVSMESVPDFNTGVLLSNLGLAYACLSLFYEGEKKLQLLQAAKGVLQVADASVQSSYPRLNAVHQGVVSRTHMALLYSLLQVDVVLFSAQGRPEGDIDNATSLIVDRLYALQNTMYLHEHYLTDSQDYQYDQCLPAAAA